FRDEPSIRPRCSLRARSRLAARQRPHGAGAPARRPRPRLIPALVGSGFVAQYPEGGGMFWVPLQYLLGLRALGVEAYWLELLWPQGGPGGAGRGAPGFSAGPGRGGAARGA